MTDNYDKFIKPKVVTKDINFFYNRINDLISNNFYAKHLYNKRKKIKIEEYVIEGHLSEIDNTRLQFINDIIIVRFIVSKTERSKVKFSKPIYKNYKIDGLVIDVNIVITPQEERNKILYPENQAFIDLRKNIHNINEFYTNKIRKSEESKYRLIYKRVTRLKKSYYSDWNKLIDLVMDCTDPYFNKILHQFEDVVCGINSDVLQMLYKMMHQTQFSQKYALTRQIRFNKFIKSFRKECLDDAEVIFLSNRLAWTLGHSISTLEESIEFIENVINHFNVICHVKSQKINSFVLGTWEKSTNVRAGRNPDFPSYNLYSTAH